MAIGLGPVQPSAGQFQHRSNGTCDLNNCDGMGGLFVGWSAFTGCLEQLLLMLMLACHR